MARHNLIVGIEIGTSKICVVVGEGLDDGAIRILGIGETPSRGIRKGEIVDFSTATQCVHDALADAEEKSNATIESVWAAVTGAHIQSLNNRGVHMIPPERGEIEDEDLREVEISAREINIPAQNTFLHCMIQRYYVDGQDGVLNPVGMIGHKLEGDFHIIHGVTTRIQNTVRCIREAGVEVEDVVVNSIASSEVVLDQNQRNLGALVIDIGGGVTDFIAYRDGCIVHSGVLAIGGDHVTNDISIGLRLPIAKAEKLKVDEGSVILGQYLPGETITIKNDPSFSGKTVEREMLNAIIHARMKELLSYVRRQVETVTPLDLLGAGVMITGGCSRLRGLKELAEEILEVPVHITSAQSVSGPVSAFENPQFSTAIGAVKYAHAIECSMPRESLIQKFSRIFRRFRII